MKVIIKNAVEPYGKETEIENRLEVLYQIVGGHIEIFPVNSDVFIICNEEGKLMNLPYNLTINGENIVGTIIVVGRNPADDDIGDLTIPFEEWRQIVDNNRV